MKCDLVGIYRPDFFVATFTPFQTKGRNWPFILQLVGGLLFEGDLTVWAATKPLVVIWSSLLLKLVFMYVCSITPIIPKYCTFVGMSVSAEQYNRRNCDTLSGYNQVIMATMYPCMSLITELWVSQSLQSMTITFADILFACFYPFITNCVDIIVIILYACN